MRRRGCRRRREKRGAESRRGVETPAKVPIQKNTETATIDRPMERKGSAYATSPRFRHDKGATPTRKITKNRTELTVRRWLCQLHDTRQVNELNGAESALKVCAFWANSLHDIDPKLFSNAKKDYGLTPHTTIQGVVHVEPSEMLSAACKAGIKPPLPPQPPAPPTDTRQPPP